MLRQPEPELMDDQEQALAYAQADFEVTHNALLGHFPRVFPELSSPRTILDLGCGPADISIRLAQLYPDCRFDAVDGAACMLHQARNRIKAAALQDRITLYLQRLPHCELPEQSYEAIVSNSLLHHLHEPRHLWSTVRKYASNRTAIFICDLYRPASAAQARVLVSRYAAGESDILRRDFYNSLLAAFTPGEVREQLDRAGLEGLQLEQVSDRHMLVHGYLQQP